MPDLPAASRQDAELLDALRHAGLIGEGEPVRLTPLAGGVSSDIFRVEVGDRVLCAKRALAKLKVAADWRAPVERNHWEVEWMRVCAAIDARMVPAVLSEDRDHGVFAMEYLSPEEHPLWKKQLSEGHIDATFAAEVGARLVRVHGATANSDAMRNRFATDHIFVPIRIEPYLLATARTHPEHAGALEELARVTVQTKRALVHGDVSPKNILAGARGPVLLDAECAWYGDPAFDLSFCLNHLLLKCLWHPRWTAAYLASFRALAGAYLAGVDWEVRDILEARAARLLAGLFLARVDGKSPAEYITQDWQRDKVRTVAGRLLRSPVDELGVIAQQWHEAIRERIETDE